MEHSFISNDIEQAVVFPTKNGHTDLSILVQDGSDAAHICISSYENGRTEPISEIRLYPEQIRYMRKLLNDPRSRQILGIDD